jgi:hypothetical protein
LKYLNLIDTLKLDSKIIQTCLYIYKVSVFSKMSI